MRYSDSNISNNIIIIILMVAMHERSYCCSLQGGAMMGCRRLGRENGGGGSDSRQMADARTGSSKTTLVKTLASYWLILLYRELVFKITTNTILRLIFLFIIFNMTYHLKVERMDRLRWRNERDLGRPIANENIFYELMSSETG